MYNVELLIIGGGPAGLSAASEATRAGVKTLLIDEAIEPGGQLIKQTHKFFGSEKQYAGVRGIHITRKLLDEINSKNFKLLSLTSAVSYFEDGVVGIIKQDKEFEKVKADRILIATGASEKLLAFPGSDLPGIYGAGGVQTLMNVYGVRPGYKVLMVGAGNIGLIVSYQLIQAGVEVVAIIEGLNRVGGYDVHAKKIQRLGVPILLSHSIKEAKGTDCLQSVIIGEVDENWKFKQGTEKELIIDTLCLAVGLNPSTEILWQADCEMKYIAELGGSLAVHDENMKTSNPNIYVAGDSAGISEASSAMVEGRIAGLNIAESLDKKIDNYDKKMRVLSTQLYNLRKGTTGEKVQAGKLRLRGEERTISMMKVRIPKIEISEERQKSRPYVIVECYQDIPCNPCEPSCKFDAIKIGSQITNLPVLDPEKCNGCMNCISLCPGLAIFGVDYSYNDKYAVLTIPYEMLPLPEKGEFVFATDREGKIVMKSEVIRVIKSPFPNMTHKVSIAVPKELISKVRGFTVSNSESPVICRCEDILEDEILDLINQGYVTFDELKRFLRVGMGPCQGRTCRPLILNMIKKITGKRISELNPGTFRSPAIPIKFSSIKTEEKKND